MTQIIQDNELTNMHRNNRSVSAMLFVTSALLSGAVLGGGVYLWQLHAEKIFNHYAQGVALICM